MAIATFNFHCCIFQNCFLARSKMTQLVAAFTVLARPLHSTSPLTPFSTLLMAPPVLHLPSRSLLNSSFGSTSIPPPLSLPSQLFSWLRQNCTSLLIPFSTLLTLSETFSTLRDQLNLYHHFLLFLLKAPFQSFSHFAGLLGLLDLYSLCYVHKMLSVKM